MEPSAQTRPKASCIPLAVGEKANWLLVACSAATSGLAGFELGTRPLRIGRTPDMDVCLPLGSISKHHATITPQSMGLVIRDNGSTNGTFLNGVRATTDMLLREGDIVQFASEAFRLSRPLATSPMHTVETISGNLAMTLVHFDRLLNEPAVVPFYQSIVDLASAETQAYEVLARSSVQGLETPRAMFEAAEQLSLERELSTVMRREGSIIGSGIKGSPMLFLNTHPMEMADQKLIDSLHDLRRMLPVQPLTIEIHEHAITSLDQLRRFRAVLDELDMRLAYDDFGVGQARLVELSEVPPDVVKFDIQLIRNIDRAPPSRQRTLSQLVNLVKDLGVKTLAEGVETDAERLTCLELGFELGQGFYFSRPAPVASLERNH